MDGSFLFFIGIGISFWAVVGIAFLANSMKRDPFLWGIYAFAIWPVALAHLLFLGDRKPPGQDQPASAASGSTADEIAKLGDLHSKGVLTEAEFNAAKSRVIGS